LGVFLKNSIPKTLLRTFAVSLLFVLSAAFSFAQNTATTVNGPGTTGAVALEIPVNPRAIAMGQAFTAVADDSSAVYWNPAGLNQMQGSELLAEYDVFINTVTYNYLNGAFKLGNDLTMGFGLKLLGSGLENIINSSGAATGGTFGETYYDIDIAAAYRLSYSLDIGITAKYITETLGTTSASTFAVDLGLMYKTPIPHLKLALDLQNLGPGIAFVQVSDPLPLIFKIGAAYQMFDDDFTMDLDVDFPNDNVVSTSLGGEYWQVRV
jgi:long-subunit fatty acid transport protein